MDWINDSIAIGNFSEATDKRLLRDAGIRSILSLDGSLEEESAEELGVDDIAAIALIDGPGNDPRRFSRAVETLCELVEQLSPVLVHCHAGRSRSVAVVAGYLVSAEGLHPHQALSRIRTERQVFIAPELEGLLTAMSRRTP